MSRWMSVLAMQIWSLPFLALYILGLVFALSRRDIGQASRYAALGFGLFILGTLMSSLNSYMMFGMREEGEFSMSQIAQRAAIFGIASMTVNFAGWGLILAAIFAKRPPPAPVTSRVE